MHNFVQDFYGSYMNLLVLGFIRPMYDYIGKESLIDDIKTDVQVTSQSLERPGYAKYRYDEALLDFSKQYEV